MYAQISIFLIIMFVAIKNIGDDPKPAIAVKSHSIQMKAGDCSAGEKAFSFSKILEEKQCVKVASQQCTQKASCNSDVKQCNSIASADIPGVDILFCKKETGGRSCSSKTVASDGNMCQGKMAGSAGAHPVAIK